MHAILLCGYLERWLSALRSSVFGYLEIQQMTKANRLILSVGVMLSGVLLLLVFSAFTGQVVTQTQICADGPCIIVRKLQTNPISLNGLLRMGEVIYRVEYYPRVGGRLFSCASLSGESQYGGKKVEANWLSDRTAEIKIDGGPVLHFSDRGWTLVNDHLSP